MIRHPPPLSSTYQPSSHTTNLANLMAKPTTCRSRSALPAPPNGSASPSSLAESPKVPSRSKTVPDLPPRESVGSYAGVPFVHASPKTLPVRLQWGEGSEPCAPAVEAAVKNTVPRLIPICSQTPESCPTHPPAPKSFDIIMNLSSVESTDLIHKQSDWGIHNRIRSAIDEAQSANDSSRLFVRRVRRLRDPKRVSVTVDASVNDADTCLTLVKEWLLELAPGVELLPQQHAVVVYGVRTSIDLKAIHAELRSIYAENVAKSVTEDVTESFRWLGGAYSIDGKEHASLLINFASLDAARRAVCLGLYIEGKHCHAREYTRGPPKCGKCQKVGHFSKQCKGKRVFRRRRGPHAPRS
ncbi:hypothetical protein BOTBODRAFT_170148 [Botryobasidium botryosum FD-172 SS1]|uniref:CCHC-type domain-containing protein n=1 Tax=Botryobasidium botryosum (strain FD-172 SS1) TaxID=930990 RepID=A0A067N7M6_BOTB1|nr:hypothetical protein BOTBODRAFT_170148 [Botryobasidium botryosum FD-172 SS1]